MIDIIWEQALTPYLDGSVEFNDALIAAQTPLRDFMFSQTRDTDLAMFAELGGYPVFATREEVPLFVLLPSFSHQRAKNGFPNWVFIIRSFLSNRFSRGSGSNVDGYDDALANHYFTPI